MVERYVFLKLVPAHATEAGRAEVVAEVERVFPALPGVRSVRVGVAAEPRSLAAWDLVLVIGFDAVEDVPAYVDSPPHRAFVDDFLAPRVDAKKAWNFRGAR